jgi:hypothetical protein
VTAQPADPLPGPEQLDALEAAGRSGELTDQQARDLLGSALRWKACAGHRPGRC